MTTIYRYNSFKKEVRFDFIDRKTGKFRLPLLGVFAALLSLAIHFILQTMTDTVLTDAIPVLMARTYFTLISTYNLVFLVTLLAFFGTNYRTRTFAEIQKNHWYLQAKMGYKPAVLVINKMLARLLTTWTNYSIGFLTILLIGFLLKYNFIYTYIISLYLSGLGDSLIILIMILTTSLLSKDSSYNTWFILLIGVGHQTAKFFSGRYELVTTPAYMRNLRAVFNVFDSPYLMFQITLALICMISLMILARYAAAYFYYPRNKVNKVSMHTVVGRIQKNQKPRKKDKVLGQVRMGSKHYPVVKIPDSAEAGQAAARALNAVLTTFATLLIVMMLIFNVIVLLLSAAQSNDEVSIRGTIPYLFHSETMDPAISRNDLVYFQQIDDQSSLDIGDIVILKDDYEVFIERVISIDGNQITVDIDNYPEMTKEDAMLKTVSRDAIYGRYSGRNRWLGAIIHFANTITGRILFLLIPSILLFYHDKILKLLERLYHNEPDDEVIESQRALHEKRQLERLQAKD